MGISRDELAKQLDLHKNTLYYIEVGTKRGDYPFRRQQISLYHFSRMAYYFGLTPSEMLGEVFARINAVGKCVLMQNNVS